MGVVTDRLALTPVEKRGQFLVKRDDLFQVAGVSGGKVRTCLALATGAKGLVTAGARESPQAVIVAHIARYLGIPCRIHMPTGKLSVQGNLAVAAGAELVQHKPGYNSVIIARARDDAKKRGWKNIPFGMECWEAVYQTAAQVKNLPFRQIERIVVPVGSGMSLAGIRYGLNKLGKPFFSLLGIQVGANPVGRLTTYSPMLMHNLPKIEQSPLPYHKHAKETVLDGLQLDPVYEAKCLPYLQPGDLLWVVGIRRDGIRLAE